MYKHTYIFIYIHIHKHTYILCMYIGHDFERGQVEAYGKIKK